MKCMACPGPTTSRRKRATSTTNESSSQTPAISIAISALLDSVALNRFTPIHRYTDLSPPRDAQKCLIETGGALRGGSVTSTDRLALEVPAAHVGLAF